MGGLFSCPWIDTGERPVEAMGQALQIPSCQIKDDCCCDTPSAASGVNIEHQLLAAIVNGETGKAENLVQTNNDDIVNCRLQVPLSDGTYMCHSDGATPLHLACLLGHGSLAEFLLDKKAQV